jgi:hypothetical protein
MFLFSPSKVMFLDGSNKLQEFRVLLRKATVVEFGSI